MTNEELLAAITAQFNELKSEIKELQSGVKDLRSDVEDLREDCEITRDGVNSLLEWADMIGKITTIPLQSNEIVYYVRIAPFLCAQKY